MKPLRLKSLEAEIKSTFCARKRLFIGLISVTSLLVSIALVMLWFVPYVGLQNIHPSAPIVFGALILLAIGIIVWIALSLVLHILLGRPIFGSHKARGIAVKLFLPLMMLLGKAIGIPRQKVQASFIKVNNELVRGSHMKYPADRILLLMPHCIQNSKCPYRLTYDIRNCKNCGKCVIGGLLELTDKYGVHLAVATGGTIARRIVVQLKPKFILAVACERDLSSGIQDTYPLPVYGVLNQRPFGPCLDTTVTLEHVEWALQEFLEQPTDVKSTS